MATGDKLVTLDVLKTVYDSQDVDTIKSDVSDLETAVQSKITEPTTDGTNGQVLTTNGAGGRSWATVNYSDLTNKPQINSVTLTGNKSLSDLGVASASDVSGKLDAPATAGTNGQVLTADGNGGASWKGTKWEIIKEETFTNDTEADKTISTDSNGNAFELTDIILAFELPSNESTASVGAYGKIKAFVDDTETASVMVGTMTRAANGASVCARAFVLQKNKLLVKFAQVRGTHSNMSNFQMFCTTVSDSPLVPVELVNETIGFTSVVIPSVTGTCHYRLFGKRKQN